MSNSYAIAAVTVTLRNILDTGVKDLTSNVTMVSLDKIGSGNAGAQLNLFLYHVARNAAWANRDMPRQVQPGETGVPPLPLDLYYLITALPSDNDPGKASDHALLGRAMQVLHDHPVLSADDIKAAAQGPQGPVPETDLDQQIERVRLTLHPLSLDEMSKLWTGFGSQYRLSAAYQVGVALIESTRGSKTPLPVLARGKGDTGVSSQADLTPPLPTLETVAPLNPPSAQLGEPITLTGFHLDGTSIGVLFQHALWTDPVEVAPDSGTDTVVKVTIPNAPGDPSAPDDWPAGFYNVAVLVQRAGEDFRRATNQLVMALAPKITIAPLAPPAGDVTFAVTVTPKVWPGQHVSFLLGDQEILAGAQATKTDSLSFDATGLKTKTIYWCRLRVDGVDSLLVDRAATPPAFIASQGVTTQ